MSLGKTDALSRLRSSYEALSSSAQSLNIASEELGKIASAMDASIKKLNIGVEAWVTIATGSDEHEGISYTEQLGYAKIDGKWGLAIRVIETDDMSGEERVDQSWLFTDAPRDKRIFAIDRLPELIEALRNETRQLHERIAKKVADARSILNMLNQCGSRPETAEVQK